jgi:hypothetical protein
MATKTLDLLVDALATANLLHDLAQMLQPFVDHTPVRLSERDRSAIQGAANEIACTAWKLTRHLEQACSAYGAEGKTLQ